MKSNRLLSGLAILIWLIVPIILYGDDGQHATFEQGNNYYAKGQFKEALKVYQQLIDKGYASPALFFNTGNTEYKLGEIPSALLYYEKARKLAPTDDDINFNIKFTNLKITDKIDEVPEFFLARWWQKFILGISISGLSVLSILFVLLASVVLIIYFFTGSVNVKKMSFYVSVILFLAGIFAVFISAKQEGYFNDHKQGIIFDAAVSVKNAPMTNSGTLFILHEGTKVNILESNNDWLKIRLANGNQGWVKINSVKEI